MNITISLMMFFSSMILAGRIYNDLPKIDINRIMLCNALFMAGIILFFQSSITFFLQRLASLIFVT